MYSGLILIPPPLTPVPRCYLLSRLFPRAAPGGFVGDGLSSLKKMSTSASPRTTYDENASAPLPVQPSRNQAAVDASDKPAADVLTSGTASTNIFSSMDEPSAAQGLLPACGLDDSPPVARSIVDEVENLLLAGGIHDHPTAAANSNEGEKGLPIPARGLDDEGPLVVESTAKQLKDAKGRGIELPSELPTSPIVAQRGATATYVGKTASKASTTRDTLLDSRRPAASGVVPQKVEIEKPALAQKQAAVEIKKTSSLEDAGELRMGEWQHVPAGGLESTVAAVAKKSGSHSTGSATAAPAKGADKFPTEESAEVADEKSKKYPTEETGASALGAGTRAPGGVAVSTPAKMESNATADLQELGSDPYAQDPEDGIATATCSGKTCVIS